MVAALVAAGSRSKRGSCMRTEPKTLDEALEWYQTGRFMREDMWALAVDRLKAFDARLSELERRNAEFMAALIVGRAPSPVPEIYTFPAESVRSTPTANSRSEKMKAAWAKRKAAQEAANGQAG